MYLNYCRSEVFWAAQFTVPVELFFPRQKKRFKTKAVYLLGGFADTITKTNLLQLYEQHTKELEPTH